MNITASEINRLKMAKSEKEWNGICDDIKEARDGVYPPDWHFKVIATGIMFLAQSNGW